MTTGNRSGHDLSGLVQEFRSRAKSDSGWNVAIPTLLSGLARSYSQARPMIGPVPRRGTELPFPYQALLIGIIDFANSGAGPLAFAAVVAWWAEQLEQTERGALAVLLTEYCRQVLAGDAHSTERQPSSGSVDASPRG